MHIPDGFLNVTVTATTYGISAVTGGISLHRAKIKFAERLVPLAGVTAAFIFAAQMINFPVAGGTSGHFLGALLACILLGPSMGFWIMALVLIVQCLLFADGGITALGANVMNMGLIGGIICYFILKGLSRLLPSGKGTFLGLSFVMAWFAVVFASTACSLELALSGTIPFKVVFPAMVTVHSIIGLGEAIITTAVLSYMLTARPDLVYAWSEEGSVGLNREVLTNE